MNSQLVGLPNDVHHADVVALTKVPFCFFFNYFPMSTCYENKPVFLVL